jgi:hypothetical protein
MQSTSDRTDEGVTLEGTLSAQVFQDESLSNPLANHSTYQCVYHGWLYFGDEDLKGNEILGCGTAPKLWPRSPITNIQGLVGTPLSTPPCLPATGVPRGSTTESPGYGMDVNRGKS